MKLSGWGRYPEAECTVHAVRQIANVRDAIAQSNGQCIARGNGRSYGDSSLQPNSTLLMTGLNRFLSFDNETGQLVAEAGVLLSDIIEVFLPSGWFLPVTPGTKYVSLGGAIAADVHGKNHHAHGSFGNYVDWIEIICFDGHMRRVSRNENQDLFEWTIGGLGLTGVIVRAAFRLISVETGWIRQTVRPASDLRVAMELFEQGQDSTYSVAWIDCLARGASTGRSLVIFGEHAKRDELGASQLLDVWSQRKRRKHSIPFDFPKMALNKYTVKSFNQYYYLNGLRKSGTGIVDLDGYFYPLDAILEWNRIYGRDGFVQFQCVVPLAASREALTALLGRIEKSGQASFLAVLKRMGPQISRFSFPMEGYTLALDFPRRRMTAALFRELERITVDHGGRFYLAKDALLTAQLQFEADPRSVEFRAMRVSSGASVSFGSLQSERLGI